MVVSQEDWKIYQIETVQKLYLIQKLQDFRPELTLKMHENHRNSVKYGRFPIKVLGIFILLKVLKFFFNINFICGPI